MPWWRRWQAQRVASLIAEISTATAEQTDGIAQVGDAVTHLEHTTQQNAALVEESAAAAQALRQQAAQLAEVVSVFRLDRDAAEPGGTSYGRAVTGRSASLSLPGAQ